ncbi:DUF6789 family protein [Pontibacter locisalis]|uniref:DUF6789 family protein n=1 Tax=Pontibacter locisalis TaxID=1719035 RepID=A0ABW5IR50_9BACT
MRQVIKHAFIGGIAGTAFMTLAMLLAPLAGLPHASPPIMLAKVMNVPLLVGWLIHFGMGVIFALAYALLFLKLEVKLSERIYKEISSRYLKGIIFGVIVFACAQAVTLILETLIGDMTPSGVHRLPLLLISLVGHIIFGIIVALFAKERLQKASTFRNTSVHLHKS